MYDGWFDCSQCEADCTEFLRKLYAPGEKEDKDLFYGLGYKEAGVPFLFQKIGSQNGPFINLIASNADWSNDKDERTLAALEELFFDIMQENIEKISPSKYRCRMDGTLHTSESNAFQHFRSTHRATVENTLSSLLDDIEEESQGYMFTKLAYSDFVYSPATCVPLQPTSTVPLPSVAAVHLVNEPVPTTKKKTKSDERTSKYPFTKEELLQVEISVFGNSVKKFKNGAAESNRILPKKNEDHESRRKREASVVTEAKLEMQKKEEAKREAAKQQELAKMEAAKAEKDKKPAPPDKKAKEAEKKSEKADDKKKTKEEKKESKEEKNSKEESKQELVKVDKKIRSAVEEAIINEIMEEVMFSMCKKMTPSIFQEITQEQEKEEKRKAERAALAVEHERKSKKEQKQIEKSVKNKATDEFATDLLAEVCNEILTEICTNTYDDMRRTKQQQAFLQQRQQQRMLQKQEQKTDQKPELSILSTTQQKEQQPKEQQVHQTPPLLPPQITQAQQNQLLQQHMHLQLQQQLLQQHLQQLHQLQSQKANFPIHPSTTQPQIQILQHQNQANLQTQGNLQTNGTPQAQSNQPQNPQQNPPQNPPLTYLQSLTQKTTPQQSQQAQQTQQLPQPNIPQQNLQNVQQNIQQQQQTIQQQQQHLLQQLQHLQNAQAQAQAQGQPFPFPYQPSQPLPASLLQQLQLLQSIPQQNISQQQLQQITQLQQLSQQQQQLQAQMQQQQGAQQRILYPRAQSSFTNPSYMYYPYATSTQPASQSTNAPDFFPAQPRTAALNPLSVSAPSLPTPHEIPTLAALSRSYVGLLNPDAHALNFASAQQTPAHPTTPPRMFQTQQASSPSRAFVPAAHAAAQLTAQGPASPVPVAPPAQAPSTPPPTLPATRNTTPPPTLSSSTPPILSSSTTPPPSAASPTPQAPAVRTVPEEYGLSSSLTLLVTHIPHESAKKAQLAWFFHDRDCVVQTHPDGQPKVHFLRAESLGSCAYVEFATQGDVEKALQILPEQQGENEPEKKDEPDMKNLLLERISIQRPPTPQTSTTGQLFTFCGQTRNVERKSIGSPSTGSSSYSQSSMLNTEQDPMIERSSQRRTFSPARVVGANKQTPPPSYLGPPTASSSPSYLGPPNSSSSLSTSPIGRPGLWGPHRDSPTAKRFSGSDQEIEKPEPNFYGSESGGSSSSNSGGASSDFNGFAGRYGNANNLFATQFYSGAAYDDGAPDIDNLGANDLDDLSHLDLGLDFDDHDDPRSPKTPPYATSPSYPSFPTPNPSLTSSNPSLNPSFISPNPSFASPNPQPAGRGVRIPKPSFPPNY